MRYERHTIDMVDICNEELILHLFILYQPANHTQSHMHWQHSANHRSSFM